MNIDTFSANITAIVSQAVRDAVEDALKTTTNAPRATLPRTQVVAQKPSKGARVSGKRPTSGRGSSLDVNTVLAEVKRQGGRSSEQLAKSLRVAPRQLRLPLTKLIAAKKIKTKGIKRGMRYTAA